MKIFSNIELQSTGSFTENVNVPSGYVRLFVYNNELYAETSQGNYIRLHQ